MPDEDEFEWVTFEADSILGDARPKKVEELLKKKDPTWQYLYRNWLMYYHADQVDAFNYVLSSGGRPRLQGRQAYDRSVEQLQGDFSEFYETIGRLKQALDPRTGAARRLGRAASKAAGAVEEAAHSRIAREIVGSTGAQVVGKAAQRVGAAAGPSGPQSGPPVPESLRPAADLSAFGGRTAQLIRAFLEHGDLATYVAALTQLAETLSRYGGQLGEPAAGLYTLAGQLGEWHQAAEAHVAALEQDPGSEAAIQAARGSAYGLAYYLDFLGYQGEAPHQVLRWIVEALVEGQAALLLARLGPDLSALCDSLDYLYYYGGQVLDAAVRVFQLHDPRYRADELADWGQAQVVGYREEVAAIRALLAAHHSDEEPSPTDQDHALATSLFGLQIDQLVNGA